MSSLGKDQVLKSGNREELQEDQDQVLKTDLIFDRDLTNIALHAFPHSFVHFLLICFNNKKV